MVKIKTKAFGEIEVSEKQRLEFPEGILGFDFIKSYYLLDMDDSPFYTLQAEDEQEVAFILIQPDFFMSDYKLMVSQSDLDFLEIKESDHLLDFVIVTIPVDPEDMTANLQGPIVINRKTHLAKQVISLNEAYTTKHPIMKALKFKFGGGA